MGERKCGEKENEENQIKNEMGIEGREGGNI